MNRARKRSFGVIGGLGALASADVFFKLARMTAAASGAEHGHIAFEQHPFPEVEAAGEEKVNLTARKLYVFDLLKTFQQRGVDTVLLPCFISHTFLDELTAESLPPVVNLMEAVRAQVARRFPTARRLGVLTSDYVRHRKLFERYFEANEYTLIYPCPQVQTHCLMAAIYGPHGIKAGQLQGESIRLLQQACADLVEQGAELILPGFTEIPLVLDSLSGGAVPIVDCNQTYAQWAVDCESGAATKKVYQVGILGGVGPAATVDFMNKIIRATAASCDQEHLKLVVEHNPQIPDRTANLVGEGADPTVALYAACKKLEAADADLIAIPCNTAHAFVERIQPYLMIPIVNMLFETIRYIQQGDGASKTIGLLATDGTLKSRVYHDAAEEAGLRLVTPESEYQRQLMHAIYGERGIKAGYTDGDCKAELLAALEHLVRDQAAEIVILGCTELPLLLAQSDSLMVAGRSVVVLDPTEILARKCVSLVRQGS